jgi:UDP-MurNAc hydroxylase
MKIEFVNHASFIVDFDGIRLLSDPWLFGTAFNDGWDLLCDYKFDFEKFKNIQYIWFSHEHPDHFSPAVLKSIKEEYRKNITILFQVTADKKVVNFCKQLGFKILEMKDLTYYSLSSKFKVKCCNVPFFDSWLLFELDKTKVLNVNDCIVDGDGKVEEIEKQTGQIDVLFTQFSYAGWKGNVGDIKVRQASAKGKLDIVKKQINVFKPKYTIPFASYVYFSHVENKYLNDSVNKPIDAFKVIKANDSKPIIMYPGSVWTIGNDDWDNEIMIENYEKEYVKLQDKVYHKPKVNYSELELLEVCDNYLKRLKSKNSFNLIKLIRLIPKFGFFKPFKIKIYDLDRVYEFDILKGLTHQKDDQSFDIKLHSESLWFVFKHDYGYDTLTVNGRFEASMSSFRTMTQTFGIGPLNNIGKSISPKLIFDVKLVTAFLNHLFMFIKKMKKIEA